MTKQRIKTSRRRSQRGLPKTLPGLIRLAWKVKDQLEAEANRQALRRGKARDPKLDEAIEVALSALYFKQTHKWEGMLQQILHLLDPELAKVAEERGYSAAYSAYTGEED
jgi:hypothetical protein